MGTNVMIEEANKEKLAGCQSAASERDVAGDRARNIIDFESGCRELEKDSLHDERDRVRLVDRLIRTLHPGSEGDSAMEC